MSVTREEIKVKLEEIIREVIQLDDVDVKKCLDNNESLEKIGVNSVSFIQIIVEIEKTYGIELNDDVLVLEDMESTNSFIDIIKNQIKD